MSGENLTELPVPELPNGPPYNKHVRYDIIDVTNIPRIDENKHGLDCDCGCAGDALILSETGKDGAYLASTVTVATFDP